MSGFHKTSLNPDLPFLAFFGKSKENHPKKQGFFSLPKPLNPWERREKRSKKQGNSLQRKKPRKSKKQGKEDQGRENRLVDAAYCWSADSQKPSISNDKHHPLFMRRERRFWRFGCALPAEKAIFGSASGCSFGDFCRQNGETGKNDFGDFNVALI